MRRLAVFVAMAVMAFGAAAVGLTLDEALALFSGDDISVAYSDEGRALVEAMIDAFKNTLGVTDSLNEKNEDRVMEFEVDLGLKDVVNKLSQTYYTYANVFLPADENEETYLIGKHWGLKSLRMDPGFAELEDSAGFVAAAREETDVPALYWATANWLRVSQKHPMQAVFAGVPAKTQAMSERCLELAPTYVAGGPYRSLGAYYSGLPIGQDLDKTLCYFAYLVDEPVCADCDVEELLPIEKVPGAEEYLENLSFMAEFYYMEKGMWEDAARVLQQILEAPIGDLYPLYNELSHENAAGLLEEVNKHL